MGDTGTCAGMLDEIAKPISRQKLQEALANARKKSDNPVRFDTNAPTQQDVLERDTIDLLSSFLGRE